MAEAAYSEGTHMATIVLPCFGGPHDGSFYSRNSPPLGYREFSVRGRMVWLWKSIHIERLDFGVLGKASKMQPDDSEAPEAPDGHQESI